MGRAELMTVFVAPHSTPCNSSDLSDLFMYQATGDLCLDLKMVKKQISSGLETVRNLRDQAVEAGNKVCVVCTTCTHAERTNQCVLVHSGCGQGRS